MLIKVLACLNMTAIAYQDFKYRAIHWFLFLTLSAILIIDGVNSKPLNQYCLDVTFNIIIIIIQFVILLLFYSLRGRKFSSIINRLIGTGDIIFILILSLAYPWESFLFLYLAALIFSVIIWLIVKNLFHVHDDLIPFAGLMAVFCLIIFSTELFFPGFNRYNNGFLTLLLHG